MPDEVAHGPHVRRAVKKEITVALAQHAFTVQAMAGAVAIAQGKNRTLPTLIRERIVLNFAKCTRRGGLVKNRYRHLMNISQTVFRINIVVTLIEIAIGL